MKADLTVAYHDDFFPGVPGYAVEISPVRFNKEALPFDQVGHERLLDTLVPEFVPGWRFSALAVPNPHLIAFVSDEELAGPVLGNWANASTGRTPTLQTGSTSTSPTSSVPTNSSSGPMSAGSASPTPAGPGCRRRPWPSP